MNSIQSKSPLFGAAVAALLISGSACASEGFRIRYPLTGTAGGEVSAPGHRHGWVGSVSATHFKSDRLTDSDGNGYSRSVPVTVGTFSTTTPGAVNFSQSQDTVNFILGYLSQDRYAGGQLSFGINIPLHKISRTVTISAVVPPLPPALQPRAAQVNAALQAQLTTQGAALSGDVTGWGDAELSAGWIYRTDRTRVLAGATLILPTGSYDSRRAVNPGLGDYYTLRPSAAVIHEVRPGTTLAARATVGINSKNTATDYSSGNFMAYEASAVQLFSTFALGLNVFTIRQYEDDVGPGVPADGFRLKTSGVGPFVATYLAKYKLALTLAYSQNFDTAYGTPGKALRARASIDF